MRKIPALASVIPDDEFQRTADEINAAVRKAVSEKLNGMLIAGQLSENARDAGPMIVAAIAAVIHSAGYLCGSFEPSLDGDVLAGVVAAQFNEGRADFRLYNGSKQ